MALFGNITQRWVLVLFRRFGTTYRSHLQESRSPRRKAFFLNFLTHVFPLQLCVHIYPPCDVYPHVWLVYFGGGLCRCSLCDCLRHRVIACLFLLSNLLLSKCGKPSTTRCKLAVCRRREDERFLILILDIPVGMYMQKYVLLFSVVQSKTNTHICDTCCKCVCWFWLYLLLKRVKYTFERFLSEW